MRKIEDLNGTPPTQEVVITLSGEIPLDAAADADTEE